VTPPPPPTNNRPPPSVTTQFTIALSYGNFLVTVNNLGAQATAVGNSVSVTVPSTGIIRVSPSS